MDSTTQSKFNLVKAALATELSAFGKNLSDLEDCLQKAAAGKDKDKDKDKGKGGKEHPVEEGMGIGLGIGLPKLIGAPLGLLNAGVNVAATGTFDVAHALANMEGGMDAKDKIVSTVNNQSKDVDRAIANLRNSHPHLFNGKA